MVYWHIARILERAYSAAVHRMYNVITRISTNIHDGNTISTAITRFQCHKTRSKNIDAVRCLGMS